MVSQPFSVFGVLLDQLETFLDYLSGWLLVSCFLLPLWVGLDGFMYLLIEVLACLDLGGIESFLPLTEVSLEFFWVFLLHFVHIFSNMDTHDSVSMNLGIISGLSNFSLTSSFTSLISYLLDFSSSVTWESLIRMWDINSSVTSSFHCSEDSGTSSSSSNTNIKEGLEWSLVSGSFGLVPFTINCFDTGIVGI